MCKCNEHVAISVSPGDPHKKKTKTIYALCLGALFNSKSELLLSDPSLLPKHVFCILKYR